MTKTIGSTITNARDIPAGMTFQSFAADVLKPGEYLHCMIADSDEIRYGKAEDIGGTLTAHHYLPSGVFLLKGNSGKLWTWHGKEVLY